MELPAFPAVFEPDSCLAKRYNDVAYGVLRHVSERFQNGCPGPPLHCRERSAASCPSGIPTNLEACGAFSPNPAQLGMADGVTKSMASLATTIGPLGFGSRLRPKTAAKPASVLSPVSSAATGETAFEQMDDAAIMLQLRAGNMAGFDFLLRKYRRPIISFMYRMVHNQAVAEELAQEVFLRVYRSRETYRAEARFSTWLYRIATNLGVNYVRDHKSERTASTVYLDEPDTESGTTPDLPDSTPGAESAMLRRERLNSIREHVMALPERQRMAVLMHKYEEMDYRQIGDVLKLSESATKSLLFRAYQTLRERLKDYV